MSFAFGPADQNEAVIFALEGLRADFQYEVLKGLKTLEISQAELARRIGVSAAWVSQLLSDDANLTLETMARVFAALGIEGTIGSGHSPFGHLFSDSSRRSAPSWQECSPREEVKSKGDTKTQVADTSVFIRVVAGKGTPRTRMSAPSNLNGTTVNHWEVAA